MGPEGENGQRVENGPINGAKQGENGQRVDGKGSKKWKVAEGQKKGQKKGVKRGKEWSKRVEKRLKWAGKG